MAYQQRRVRRLQVLTLVLALAVLGVMLLRLAGYLGDVPGEVEATVTVMPSPAATRIQQVLPTEQLQTPQPAQTLTAQANVSTPAADWSNRVLDQSLEMIEPPLPVGAGIVWWRSSDFTGQLSASGDSVLMGGDALQLDNISSLRILTPNPSDPDQLVEQGRVDWEGDALLLSASASGVNRTSADWLLSRGTIAQALVALVEEAEAREIVLNAAYTGLSGGESRLVLISASELGGATPTPAPTNPGYTPTPTRTPTPLPTATPTRVPEAYMGQVIAELFLPVIDSTDDFPREAVQALADSHPWTGALTWTETGPQIGGLPVAVNDAEELNFYTFQTEGEEQGATERFLQVTYNGSVTRFPEQQLIFQEQRMDEVLYWVVRAAAEQGGQLVVAFDDFGARQAITVLDFRPYQS